MALMTQVVEEWMAAPKPMRRNALSGQIELKPDRLEDLIECNIDRISKILDIYKPTLLRDWKREYLNVRTKRNTDCGDLKRFPFFLHVDKVDDYYYKVDDYY